MEIVLLNKFLVENDSNFNFINTNNEYEIRFFYIKMPHETKVIDSIFTSKNI